MLLSLEKKLAIPLFISFIMVDAYGMIDNTYHMFYYMIPLVTMLACFDSAKENNDSSSTIKEENTYFIENKEIETKEQI